MEKSSIFFVVIMSLVSGFTSCKREKPATSQGYDPVPINIYKVVHRHVAYYDDYPGTTAALKEVQLTGKVTGYLTGIFFRDGQHVTKGQKLYEIDRSEYLASYQQSVSGVHIAQANLEKAMRDAKRYSELNAREAIARQQYENAMTVLKNSQLQVSTAKNDSVKASLNLGYSQIKAPFDGTIGISSVRIGALITPGQTILNVVSTDNPMGVDFEVNENELIRFGKLQKKPLNEVDTVFKIILPDDSIYPYGGQIEFIDRAINPQTGTIRIRLSFPNSERLLKPGMSCNVQVLNREFGPKLLIPYKAVVEQMGEYFAYVVNGKQANQVKLLLGSKVGDNVIVNKGLKEGQIIVTEGIQKLHNGSLIQVGQPSLGKSRQPK